MTVRSKRLRGPALAVVLGGALAALFGTAAALAHGGDETLIHSCVKPQGQLRIVGANATCRPNERPLDWSRGELALTLRENSQVLTLEPGGHDSVLASCVGGEAVTGGGLTNVPGEVTTGSVEVTSDGPQFDGVNSGWIIVFRNDSEETVTISPGVSAICAPGTMSSG
jgi:hypothetical protein